MVEARWEGMKPRVGSENTEGFNLFFYPECVSKCEKQHLPVVKVPPNTEAENTKKKNRRGRRGGVLRLRLVFYIHNLVDSNPNSVPFKP